LSKRQITGSLSCLSAVGALGFSSDGACLVTAEWGGRVTRWRRDTLEPVQTSTISANAVAAACFSPDCRTLPEE
jgi:hypothetical protein